MKVDVYTLNSFAKTPDGGNPAGVVLDSDSLTEKQMMLISEKVGFSETAFVQNSKVADFKVRFFTPIEEVDLCGHATIATYFLMWSLGMIKNGNYKQETKAGVLGIEVTDKGTIFMNQILPQFFEEIDKWKIASSLNITIDYFADKLPVQIVSTGLKDILIPIKNIKDLNSINPDFEKIKDICKLYKTIGYHVFTLETKFKSTAYCRNFAPLFGIPEESATGTSNGGLGCYLYKHGKLNNIDLNNLVFEQGYSMNKPSEILAKLNTQNGIINEVKVGGIALIRKLLKIEI